jgi:hypothetical protein
MELIEKISTPFTTGNEHNKPIATKRVIFMGMLFVSFLVVSNLTAI